jgi:hypothetical protein
MARRLAPGLPVVAPIVPVLYPQPFDGPNGYSSPSTMGPAGFCI